MEYSALQYYGIELATRTTVPSTRSPRNAINVSAGQPIPSNPTAYYPHTAYYQDSLNLLIDRV